MQEATKPCETDGLSLGKQSYAPDGDVSTLLRGLGSKSSVRPFLLTHATRRSLW